MSSALHDFSVQKQIDAEFERFKAEQPKGVAVARGNQRFWKKIRLTHSIVSVVNNKERLNVVLNAHGEILDQPIMNQVNQQMLKRAKGFGLMTLMSTSV